jgi:hypothetical protein
VIPGVSTPNTAYGLSYHDDEGFDRRWTVTAPFWIAVGAIAYDPTDDYDVSVYNYTYNPFPPPCFTPLLGTSAAGAGTTDFVVGDFNHNLTGEYMNGVKCYSGHCDDQPRGYEIWRDGDLFFVDDPPTVLTLPTLADRLLKIWDIYLVQGTTYHFRFQPTGDTQPKLLLFRNPTGGVFWTGRFGAEFETAECITNYTAPSTGYYGMVVVNDRYSGNPVAITVAVTTGLACACPGVLASGVPQTIPSTRAEAANAIVQPDPYWMAVGVRSNSDWDLAEGTTATSGVDMGCIQNFGAISSLFPPKADVVVGDFNFYYPLPDTLGTRAVRYSGADGATVEMEAGGDNLIANGPIIRTYMISDEVVKGFDGWLYQGRTYTIRFFPSVDEPKLLLFDNPSHLANAWLSRGQALLELTGPTTFVPPHDGYYAFVLVKDDATIPNYDLSYGFCPTPTALASKTPALNTATFLPAEEIDYYSFNQQTANWGAACVFGATADWDIAQYGQASGNPWPECLGSAGAISNGFVGTDLIVGDFHHVPTGNWYLHSYPAAIDGYFIGFTEWDAGSGTLQVNPAQATSGTMTLGVQSDRLWCYDVYLYGGLPYTLAFTHAGPAAPRALVFENPGSAPYWAPRTAAILSTNTSTAFTPSTTGWHAVVVVNDNDQDGSFSLRVTSSVLAVNDEPAPSRDELSAVAPNPAHGPLRIDYALARPSQVSFEVIDLAGRVVCRLPATSTGAGRWSQAWDGRGGSGQALAGGVYMLRMQVNGRTVATRKIMRLN